MQTLPPPLLPILRTSTQAALLAELYLGTMGEQTISDLARKIGAEPATVMREVDRLEAAGIVVSRRVGRNRMVSVNAESLYTDPLRRLVTLGFGPARQIGPTLSLLDGVEAVYLFGSWAARFLGKTGPDPHDVDVLVIGEPDRDAVFLAADALEEELGRPIQITIRSRAQWEDTTDPFIATVRERPLIDVTAHPADS
jgi:DNA-binding transcriptional ArsR family regulator